MSDLTGHELGRYHLLEKLGEGGMAAVYKAYDTRLEREVAVKIIRSDLFGNAVIERILKRFEREAKAMAKFSHANIVKVYDYGEHEGSPYIVMELLSGGTLKQKLGKPMPWRDAVSLLEPIAKALSYAHSEGILHRDVKPANILITKAGEPVLTDFGIAKLLEQEDGQTLTGTGVGIGTPEYMAPEQGLGQVVDGRADVYSLGIVFYELITGRKPFIADTPLAILFKQMNDPLPRPISLVPNLPESVEQVILKALAKQPEDRFKGMSEFATALHKLEKSSESFPQEEITSLEATRLDIKEYSTIDDPYATVDKIVVDENKPSIMQEFKSAKVENAKTPERLINRKGVHPWQYMAGGAGLIGLLVVILWVSGVFKPPAIVVPTKTPTNMMVSVTQEILHTVTPIPPTPTKELRIGSTQLSPKDGMVIIYVPAGEFTMGSTEGNSNEQPVHQVFLDAYWIDRTEVTNAMYKKCVEGGICTLPNSTIRYDDSMFVDHPVTYVDWNQADAYCAWAGRGLPTEAQWEKAARGTDERNYPWGNQNPTCWAANFYGCIENTSPVGYFGGGKSPYGAYDMTGNVWEWVADWYGSYAAAVVTNPLGSSTGENRVLRGGSWYNNEYDIRTTYRLWNSPSFRNSLIGFRCAIPSVTTTSEITNTDSSSTGDEYLFIQDVTIPDDAIIQPATVFTKTWQIKNMGTTIWTKDYHLVFDTGLSPADGSTTVILNSEVNPGDLTEISIDFVAPSGIGTYNSNWKLCNKENVCFGLPLYVRFKVVN